VSCIFHH